MRKSIVCLFGLGGLWFAGLLQASQFTFSIGNNTDREITSLSASQDGSEWRPIRISGSIAAHSISEINWNSKADKSACVWQVKAHFKKGEESEAVEFDFCAADPVLSFRD